MKDIFRGCLLGADKMKKKKLFKKIQINLVASELAPQRGASGVAVAFGHYHPLAAEGHSDPKVRPRTKVLIST